MRDISERLIDIQEAITNITRYTNRGRQVFDESELVQNWVVHHLEIIGEAARSIPSDFKALHPEILWQQIRCVAAAFMTPCQWLVSPSGRAS